MRRVAHALWLMFACLALAGVVFASGLTGSGASPAIAAETVGNSFTTTSTVAPADGERAVLGRSEDGEVVLSESSQDPWVSDPTVDDKNPLLAYTAAFAMFFIVTGAGMRAIDYWKEIH